MGRWNKPPIKRGRGIDIRVMLSSCVPSSDLRLRARGSGQEELAALADHPRALGLAEVMNYPGVVAGDPECLAKLQAFRGRHIDGHAPLLSGAGAGGLCQRGHPHRSRGNECRRGP